MPESGDTRQLFRLFRSLAGTDDQVESGIKCYRRPDRSNVRKFTAQDAARITCYAVRAGATHAEIERRVQKTCPRPSDRSRANVAEEAIALAQEAIQGNTAQLLEEWRAFVAVNVVLVALLALLGVIQNVGPARLVAGPLRIATRVSQTQVAQLITMNITRRAANDRVFQQLEQLKRAA